MVLDLQVDQLDCVTGAPYRLRDELEAERLKSKEYLRIEQRARVDAEESHELSSFR